jgi:hypothetical protein
VDLLRARHRLSKMLLRRDLRYVAGRAWTQQHRAWLWSLVLERAAERAVLEDYLLAVDQIGARLQALEGRLLELAEQEPYRERVGWLRCFRGIDTVTAMILLAELHGFERFHQPRQLMAYVGLVPSESSSGASVRRGGITKTGNRHLRRLLVETAHHYRHRPGVGAALRKRRVGQPAAVIGLADRAQQRLHRRYSRLLLGRGQPVSKVVVACARELTGFLWALLYSYPKAARSGDRVECGVAATSIRQQRTPRAEKTPARRASESNLDRRGFGPPLQSAPGLEHRQRKSA